MDKKITGALIIDLCKAFDSVSHSSLLSKLLHYGSYQTGVVHKAPHLAHCYGAYSKITEHMR